MFETIDLTRRLSGRTLEFPGDRPGFITERVDLGRSDVQLTHVRHLDLHLGTHIDAPLHFIPGGADIASLDQRLLPGIVIRARGGAIPPGVLPTAPLRGCAVLFDTGWTVSAESRAYFEGFPHLSPEIAAELADRGAALVGIDSPSADAVDADLACPAHRTLLGAGIPIVEGLANLCRLPDGVDTFWLGVFPLPIEGADGSPVRAVAFVPAGKSARPGATRRPGETK